VQGFELRWFVNGYGDVDDKVVKLIWISAGSGFVKW